MGVGTNRRIRGRDVELVLVSVLVGPALGAALVVAAAIALQASSSMDLVSEKARIGLEVAMEFAYVLGVLPAFASAVLAGVAARFTRGRRRLGAAFLSGVAGTVLTPPAVLVVMHEPGLTWLALAVGVAGGLAALACTALVERFGSPLPVSEAR